MTEWIGTVALEEVVQEACEVAEVDIMDPVTSLVIHYLLRLPLAQDLLVSAEILVNHACDDNTPMRR